MDFAVWTKRMDSDDDQGSVLGQIVWGGHLDVLPEDALLCDQKSCF